MNRNLNIYIFYALISISWLVPNHYSPWLAFHSEWVACAAVVISFVILLNKNKAELPLISIFLLFVSLVPVFQYFFGLIYYKGDALIVFSYLFLAGVAAILGFNYQGEKETLYKGFAFFILFSGIISMWIALGQWFSVNSLGVFAVQVPLGGRVYANLAQPNQFATFLMLNFCGVFYLFKRGILGTVVALLLLLFFGWGLSLAQSRAGFLEMMIFGVLGIFLFGKEKRSRNFFIAGLVIFLAIWVFLLPWVTSFLEFSELRKDKSSLGVRYIHWKTALSAISVAPWFGYGWNQVSVALAKSVNSYPPTHEFLEHSHNLLLDVLIWNGIPLSLFFIVVVFVWCYKFILFKMDSVDKCIVILLLCVIVHSMLEFPLDYAYFLMPFFFLLGVLEKGKGEKIYFCINNVFLRKLITPIILVSGLLWIGYDYLNVENGVRNLHFESRGLSVDGDENSLNNIKLFDQQKNYILFARSAAKDNMSEEQLDWMRKISERYGYAPVLLRYAMAAGLNGRPKDAIEALIRICKTSSIVNCNESRNYWNNLRVEYSLLPDFPDFQNGE